MVSVPWKSLMWDSMPSLESLQLRSFFNTLERSSFTVLPNTTFFTAVRRRPGDSWQETTGDKSKQNKDYAVNIGRQLVYKPFCLISVNTVRPASNRATKVSFKSCSKALNGSHWWSSWQTKLFLVNLIWNGDGWGKPKNVEKSLPVSIAPWFGTSIFHFLVVDEFPVNEPLSVLRRG